MKSQRVLKVQNRDIVDDDVQLGTYIYIYILTIYIVYIYMLIDIYIYIY